MNSRKLMYLVGISKLAAILGEKKFEVNYPNTICRILHTSSILLLYYNLLTFVCSSRSLYQPRYSSDNIIEIQKMAL
jgi:hypothetical protein